MTSATQLLDHLRTAAVRFRDRGRKLNEGADRVLRKLESVRTVEGMRRAYYRNGGAVVMWDLVSDEELSRRGFEQTRHHACRIFTDDLVKNDRVTCWISDAEPTDELWIGEALAP
ncbi:MAG TPA: hypothetical protein VMU84_13280 [Thermoanaerobaculia bacterium]|nr:hypothetical protein [Thermoanaerobaculia bacterium]